MPDIGLFIRMHIVHEASVADAFNYDDGSLVGTLDFINEPGRFRLDLRVLFDDDLERTVGLEF